MPSQSMKHFTENLLEALDNPLVVQKIALQMERHLVTDDPDVEDRIACRGILFHRHHVHSDLPLAPPL